MGKQWVRAQIKKNEVQEAVEGTIRWAAQNRQTAGITAAAVVAVLLFGGLFLYSHRAKQNAAWDEFSLANGLAYTGRADAAIKKVDEITSNYATTEAAGYALLFAGDLLFHRDAFADSEKYYSQLVERGKPKVLQPFALGGLALAQEAANQCADSLKTGQRFLDAFPDHFLAPQVQASAARCLASTGQAEAAKAALQKMSIQYPETSWAAWAQEKLKAAGAGK